MKQNKKVTDFIVKNWKKMTNVEIAQQLGISRHTVIRTGKRLGLDPKYTITPPFKSSPKESITHDKSMKEKIKHFLIHTKQHVTLENLTDKFDCGSTKIKTIIEQLKQEGFNLSIDEAGFAIQTTGIGKRPATEIKSEVGKWVKVGFVTDNHLGSNYERLDVLNALYERFEKEGITTVYNAGNVIDGEARFNRFDIHKHGMESQCRYFAEVYPQIKGLKTFYITGDDHEGWYTQREGVEIGRFLEKCCHERGRDDLIYLGHMEHDIELKAPNGSAILRIVHPGMGSAYAISYTSQKLVETYTPGEKPNILLMGHYHKAEFLHYRGVFIVQGGCTMDQSPFMRKKRLSAHVGGWILEYQQGDNGTILSFKCEWIPFYDRDSYDKKWSYKTSY